MIFMMISKDMEEDWSLDIMHYVTDHTDEDSYFNNVRSAARAVLMVS